MEEAAEAGVPDAEGEQREGAGWAPSRRTGEPRRLLSLLCHPPGAWPGSALIFIFIHLRDETMVSCCFNLISLIMSKARHFQRGRRPGDFVLRIAYSYLTFEGFAPFSGLFMRDMNPLSYDIHRTCIRHPYLPALWSVTFRARRSPAAVKATWPRSAASVPGREASCHKPRGFV